MPNIFFLLREREEGDMNNIKLGPYKTFYDLNQVTIA